MKTITEKYTLSDFDLESIGFSSSPIAKSISTNPLGFIDVGANNEIIDEFKSVSHYLNVIFFEPNKTEYNNLLSKKNSYKSCKFFNCALSNDNKEANLYITNSSMCSSLYLPNEHYTKRYGLTGYDIKKIETVSVSKLDSVLKNEQFNEDDFYILKLDAQGADLDIINGAVDFIKKYVYGIVSEVSFFPSYEGIPLFSDVEIRLRELGFSFITFTDYMFRSYSRSKPSSALSRQRLFHADALFIKDPILNINNINKKCAYHYITFYMLYNLFDSAKEIAEKLIDDINDKMATLQVISKAEELYLNKSIIRASSGLEILKSSNDNKEILYYLNNRTVL